MILNIKFNSNLYLKLIFVSPTDMSEDKIIYNSLKELIYTSIGVFYTSSILIRSIPRIMEVIKYRIIKLFCTRLGFFGKLFFNGYIYFNKTRFPYFYIRS